MYYGYIYIEFLSAKINLKLTVIESGIKISPFGV